MTTETKPKTPTLVDLRRLGRRKYVIVWYDIYGSLCAQDDNPGNEKTGEVIIETNGPWRRELMFAALSALPDEKGKS